MIHVVFCVVGFTRFTLCFVFLDLRDSQCVCVFGFTRFALCFVLLDSDDLLCVLCCFIHIIYLVFRASGFTRFTLYFIGVEPHVSL